MTLAGTRPILPGELEQYELHHRTRIAIKPGITGMWQVSGVLTFISLIPNLQFDFPKAKKWFNIKKNSRLLGLYNMGMLMIRIRLFATVLWRQFVQS